jgi:glycosyltransferase involved in cell wall biosynthesis
MKKVTIYSTRYGGPYQQYRLLQRYLQRAGYEVTLHHTLGAMVRSLLLDRKDAVISNVPLPFRFGAKTYILNIHGDFSIERHLFRNPLAFLYPVALRVADGVVVPSEFLRNRLNLDARIIPNAIPRTSGRKVTAGSARLMTTTSFAFRAKAFGVLQLAKALASLHPATKVTYDVFGDGTFLDAVKREVSSLHFDPLITVAFRGRSSEIAKELLASDAFLYWSELDNMPLAVFEAMAAGLPVICNEVGAIGEVIRDGRDAIISRAEDLASNIERLIKNPEMRRAFGIRGRRRVRNLLGPALIAQQWRSLIEK